MSAAEAAPRRAPPRPAPPQRPAPPAAPGSRRRGWRCRGRPARPPGWRRARAAPCCAGGAPPRAGPEQRGCGAAQRGAQDEGGLQNVHFITASGGIQRYSSQCCRGTYRRTKARRRPTAKRTAAQPAARRRAATTYGAEHRAAVPGAAPLQGTQRHRPALKQALLCSADSKKVTMKK